MLLVLQLCSIAWSLVASQICESSPVLPGRFGPCYAIIDVLRLAVYLCWQPGSWPRFFALCSGFRAEGGWLPRSIFAAHVVERYSIRSR
jgi:hypothetical protein